MPAALRSYPASLRITLRNTAAAYGYTLTIGSTALALTSTHETPRAGSTFLFAIGGLIAFAVLETIVHLSRVADDPTPDHAFPFAGALNFVSVAAGLGAATGIAHAVDSGAAWLLAPMGATAAYMIVVALQVAMVSAIGE